MEKTISEKLDNKLNEYSKVFEEKFPMFQLNKACNDIEMIEIINKCLKEKKNAFDLEFAVKGKDWSFKEVSNNVY